MRGKKERCCQAPGKMGSEGWLAAAGSDYSRGATAWDTKHSGRVTIILTLEIQHKCAAAFLRNSGPLVGRKAGDGMRRANRRVSLNPLWCVYFLNDHARSGIGQEEDLEGKGLKSRAALQTHKRKGCFLLIHSSLSSRWRKRGGKTM